MMSCPAVPVACRTPIVPGRASVLIDDRLDDAKDQLQFKWTRGAATTWAELGDPQTTDAYDLCVYDDGGLRAAHAIPAGGTCKGTPCWRPRPNGYVYRDSSGAVQGITRVDLVSGIDGKAQVRAKGKGDPLPLPAPASVVSPLTVQLRNRTNGVCFGASFTAPFDTATATKLKDRAD